MNVIVYNIVFIDSIAKVLCNIYALLQLLHQWAEWLDVCCRLSYRNFITSSVCLLNQ